DRLRRETDRRRCDGGGGRRRRRWSAAAGSESHDRNRRADREKTMADNHGVNAILSAKTRAPNVDEGPLQNFTINQRHSYDSRFPWKTKAAVISAAASSPVTKRRRPAGSAGAARIGRRRRAA